MADHSGSHHQSTDGMNQAGGSNATGKSVPATPRHTASDPVPRDTDTGTGAGTSKPSPRK